mmetsp:Transcript_14286/g.28217  ORF Transcript_14286/g.28217 Transcript_14286/m.28217 type:complete len:333 (+) Transcript_14286:121-1119(+)
MSRLLKWDGSEMDMLTEVSLRFCRMLFSTWTKHAVVLGALTVGVPRSPTVSKIMLGVSAASYAWRVFCSHAGGHRYFAHLSFRTSQVMELLMAVTVQCSASNENIVYWINFHEHHHKTCETEDDVHSPWHQGLLNVQTQDSSSKLVTTQEGIDRLFRRDLLQYRFLNDLIWLRDHQMALKVLEHASWVLAGWDAFFWGCCLPNVLHFHAIRLTNSAAHMWGYKPYIAQFQPQCKATNNWWVALFNGGEGWHNNHHAFMGSCRHGFMWWEFDWVYLMLKGAAKLGLVWDLKVVTDDVKNARYKNLDKRTVGITRLYQIEDAAKKHVPGPAQLI